MKEMKITAIENGTVIDHIPQMNTFKVVEILSLMEKDNVIMVGENLPSKKLGKKGIVKISNRFLTKKEADKIAIVAPGANINTIRNFEVEKKEKLSIPDIVESIVKCANPNCITNIENHPTKFHVLKRNPLMIKCHYCERVMHKNDIELI
ncbi:MAG: aspartate carbamoyltransferase regulatory subunit [Candidatus Micrarchaeota archaeon]|nr:aspartate carbamoyltransferase regulatory subunit [Candidatus Micrarchaeota archaeon]